MTPAEPGEITDMTTPENFAACCCAEVSDDGILTVTCAVRDPRSGGVKKFERTVDLNPLTKMVGERLARWHAETHGTQVAGWFDFLGQAASAARSIAESVSTKQLFRQVAPLLAPIVPGAEFALAMFTHDTVAHAREGNRVALAKVDAIAKQAQAGNQDAQDTVALMRSMADKLDQKDTQVPVEALAMVKSGQMNLSPDGYYAEVDPYGDLTMEIVGRRGHRSNPGTHRVHGGGARRTGYGSGQGLGDLGNGTDQGGYGGGGGGGGDPGTGPYGDGGYHQQVEDQFGLAPDQRGYDPRWGGPTDGGFERNQPNYEAPAGDSGDPDYYAGLTVAGILVHPYQTPAEKAAANAARANRLTYRGTYATGLGR